MRQRPLGPLDPIFDDTRRKGQLLAVGNTPPGSWFTVTINQGSSQDDPAFDEPIIFDVTFSGPTLDFATGDVTITGSAGGTKTATVVDTGDHIHFLVNVTGMTSVGTVTASISAGVCTEDGTGASNLASISTDNTVEWGVVIPDDVGGLYAWYDTTERLTVAYAACGQGPGLLPSDANPPLTSQTDLGPNNITLVPTSGTGPSVSAVTGITGGRWAHLFSSGYLANSSGAPSNLFSGSRAMTLFLVSTDRGNSARFSISGTGVGGPRCMTLFRTSSTNLVLQVGNANAGAPSTRQYDYTLAQLADLNTLRLFTLTVDASGADPILRVDGVITPHSGISGGMVMTSFWSSTPANAFIQWGGDPSSAVSMSGAITTSVVLYNEVISSDDLGGVEAYLDNKFFQTNDGEYIVPHTAALWPYVVPAGVSSVHLELWGAQGGDNSSGGAGTPGGLGGFLECDLATSGGSTLNVYVGGMGETGQQIGGGGAHTGGGWNGGGDGGAASPGGGSNGGGGGGGTDIRVGGVATTDRVAIAAGGGGACNFTSTSGGAGGASTGEDGNAGGGVDAYGLGGSQVAGGTGSGGGLSGAFYQGGYGNSGSTVAGGGGGGGYYGGGGGGFSFTGGLHTGSGGGGSNYAGAGTSGVTSTRGVRSCHGFAIITPN